MSGTGILTSALLWRSALVAALIDTPLLILIARLVSGELFRKLKWFLVGAAFFVYAVLWGVFGSLLFWNAVYSAIFPVWMHWLLPLIYGLLFGALALAFWQLCHRAARLQAVKFILLGGLVSLAGHGIGISRGLMRVPMLAQASAASALTFGVFEFIFYWCIIVGIGAVARYLGQISHR